MRKPKVRVKDYPEEGSNIPYLEAEGQEPGKVQAIPLSESLLDQLAKKRNDAEVRGLLQQELKDFTKSQQATLKAWLDSKDYDFSEAGRNALARPVEHRIEKNGDWSNEERTKIVGALKYYGLKDMANITSDSVVILATRAEAQTLKNLKNTLMHAQDNAESVAAGPEMAIGIHYEGRLF